MIIIRSKEKLFFRGKPVEAAVLMSEKRVVGYIGKTWWKGDDLHADLLITDREMVDFLTRNVKGRPEPEREDRGEYDIRINPVKPVREDGR